MLSDTDAERFQRTKDAFISTIPLVGKNVLLSPAVGGKASFADGQPVYPEPITEAVENCVS